MYKEEGRKVVEASKKKVAAARAKKARREGKMDAEAQPGFKHRPFLGKKRKSIIPPSPTR